MKKRKSFIEHSLDFVFNKEKYIEKILKNKFKSKEFINLKNELKKSETRLKQLLLLKNFFTFETKQELENEILNLGASPLKDFLIYLRDEFDLNPDFFLENDQFENLTLYQGMQNILESKLAFNKTCMLINNKKSKIETIKELESAKLENQVKTTINSEENSNYFFQLLKNDNITNKTISRTKNIALLSSKHLQPSPCDNYFRDSFEPHINSFNLAKPMYIDTTGNYYYKSYKNEPLKKDEYLTLNESQKNKIHHSNRLDVNRSFITFQKPYSIGDDKKNIEFFILLSSFTQKNNNSVAMYPSVGSRILLKIPTTTATKYFTVFSLHYHKNRKVGTIILIPN